MSARSTPATRRASRIICRPHEWISHKTTISPPKSLQFVTRTSDWSQQLTQETEPTEEEDESNEAEESYSEPPEEAKIFVGNLPYDFDSEKLANLFNTAGVVEIAEVIYNRDTQQSRGFGFVTMSTVEEAEKAVEKFNGYYLSGTLLTVNKAAPRGSQPERRVVATSFKIYVGNLAWQVDGERLEQAFSEHGKVVDARVIYDRESGKSRGFGFVTMASESNMNDAVSALDGQELDGRAIRVNVAEWFTKWQNYVGVLEDKEASPLTKPGERPGPIDNTDLVTDGGGSDENSLQLPKTLFEGDDYVLVPQGVWDKLHGWYKGGPSIPTKMISVGMQGMYSIEVHPLSLKLIDSRDKSETIIYITKKASLHELYKKVSELKGLEPERVLVMLKKITEVTKKKLPGRGCFFQEGYIMQHLPIPPNCLSTPDVSDSINVMYSDISMTMLKKVLRQVEIIKSSRFGMPNFESTEVEVNDLQLAMAQYLQSRGAKPSPNQATRYGIAKELNVSSSTKAWLEKMKTLFISKGSGEGEIGIPSEIFSSRSVITGDPYKGVGEIGIPSEIAQKITFQERVTEYNMKYLQKLVDSTVLVKSS